MTGLTIVTGAWGPNAAYYLRTLPSSFHLWPPATKMTVFTDDRLEACDGYAGFMDRNVPRIEANGRLPRPGWKRSDLAKGYSFRFDAVKFAGQAFAPEEAARDLPDGHVLCWLDADVVTLRAVPPGFIDGLLGTDDVAYLGRGWKHSEIGFWACRLNARSRNMLSVFASFYRTDEVFALAQWHSAFVWDRAREAAEREVSLKARNLTPNGHDHVFMQSPLAQYMDHLKGARKRLGRSPERRTYA